MRLVLFILFYFYVEFSGACNVPAIVCSVVCVQDGDAKGIMIGNECFCANPRDMSKVPFKMPHNLKGKAVIPPAPRWVE